MPHVHIQKKNVLTFKGQRQTMQTQIRCNATFDQGIRSSFNKTERKHIIFKCFIWVLNNLPGYM